MPIEIKARGLVYKLTFQILEEETSQMENINMNEDGFDIEPMTPPMPPTQTSSQTPPSFLLSADKVQAVRFHPAKPGYEFRQVETFVDQVSNTLGFLESLIYQYQVDLHEKQDEVYDLQDTISKLKATIEVFRASGDPMTASDGSYLTASKVADSAQLETLTNERDALQVKVLELQEQLAETKALLKDAEIEKEKLSKQLEEFKNNSISPSDLATLKAEKDILVEQLVQLKDKEEAHKDNIKELEETKKKVSDLESKLETQSDYEDIVSTNASLEAKIVELENSVDNTVTEERDKLREELEALQAAKDVNILETKEYAELSEKLEIVEKELTTKNEEVEKLTKIVSEANENQIQNVANEETLLENEALKTRLKELENKLINSKPIEQDRELIKSLEVERNSLATQLAAAQEDADKGWQAHEELKNYVDNTLMPWIEAQNSEETVEEETISEPTPAVEQPSESPFNRLAASPEAEGISIPYIEEEPKTQPKEEIKPAGEPLPRFLATAPEVLAAMEEDEED